MIYSAQTHFDAPVGRDILREVYARNFRMVRIDAQNCSVDTMLEMVAEAVLENLIPYVTVASNGQIEALPNGAWCEWRNEPDLAISGHDVIHPTTYAQELLMAAEVAKRSPVGQIGAPVVSNLNQRGTTYILKVIEGCGGALPPNVFGVTHRYGDGTYHRPHYLNWYGWLGIGPFQSREAELRWFKKTIGLGRPWGVSEWGYPSADGISEQEQASRSAKEWELYAREGAAFASIYQLNDGTGASEHFGLRRVDGSWKPVSDTVPQET